MYLFSTGQSKAPTIFYNNKMEEGQSVSSLLGRKPSNKKILKPDNEFESIGK